MQTPRPPTGSLATSHWAQRGPVPRLCAPVPSPRRGLLSGKPRSALLSPPGQSAVPVRERLSKRWWESVSPGLTIEPSEALAYRSGSTLYPDLEQVT